MRAFRNSCAWSWAVLAFVPTAAWSQPVQSSTASGSRITVPLTTPAKPATLRVSLIAGSIVVTGYEGKEVLIDTRTRDEDDYGSSSDENDREREREEARLEREREREEARRERERERGKADKKGAHDPGVNTDEGDAEDRARGLRRVPNLSSGLTVEEEDNVVAVSGPFQDRSVDLDIKVPVASELQLQTVNDGDIIVRNVRGEIEAENTNGRVTLTRVTGPVVAHALNGDVVASFVALAGDRPSSFSSMNGDIDVTLPADAKAAVRVRADNGEIFTDFDLKLETRTESLPDRGSGRGKKVFGFETGMYGTLNGGGPTLRFQTFNGNVYIRKAK